MESIGIMDKETGEWVTFRAKTRDHAAIPVSAPPSGYPIEPGQAFSFDYPPLLNPVRGQEQHLSAGRKAGQHPPSS